MDEKQSRREPRRLLPNGDSLVAAQLRRDRIHLSGRLWDLSPHGCCLCSHSDGPAPAVREDAVLLINDPCGKRDLELCVLVIWVEREERARFIGLQFLAPVDFSATFLASELGAESHTLQRS